jgi:glycine/D-amino acid oxidase-like deaminating enzyme/nitrite reductase/ring-hydroxylating ferredoxin subunit
MENIEGNAGGQITSGTHQSYWIASTEPLKFEPLSENLNTEVAIVGAGISGLTVAYCLLKSGKKVVVLEDGFIGSGETGRTTAHIANALDDRYTEIESYFGAQGAKYAAESHTSAIDLIEEICTDEAIDCDFRRVDGYLFLHPSDKRKSIEDEYKYTHKAGISTELVMDAPSIKQEGPFLKYPRQAQFHPLKYLNGLAEAVVRMGGEIFTNTHADTIKEGIINANGHEVKASYIVVATNTPVNDWFTIHTKQFAYRSYVIAARVPKNAIDVALWWDTGDANSEWPTMPYNYVRTQPLDENNYLLIHGGADHETGQANKDGIREEDRYQQLEAWLREHFPQAGEIRYKWSGQVMEPMDDMAYIGKNPGDDNIYIVTGDSGNGITHGTVAGILISDLINGIPNPWAELYDPSRITLKAMGTLLQEQAKIFSRFKDYLLPSDVKSLSEIRNGEAAIVGGLKKIAVYRDSKGQYHAYSAVCPHMGCVVQWNNDEKSFDCPCHGSRFTCEGKVINGPAKTDLSQVDVPQTT